MDMTSSKMLLQEHHSFKLTMKYLKMSNRIKSL